MLAYVFLQELWDWQGVQAFRNSKTDQLLSLVRHLNTAIAICKRSLLNHERENAWARSKKTGQNNGCVQVTRFEMVGWFPREEAGISYSINLS